MAAITPTRGATGVSTTGYTSAEHFQAIANSYANLSWAAGTTWDVSSDVLTITGATAYSFFVDPVTGNLRDIRMKELREIPRPASKRYMTAAVTAPDTVVLTLSDTHSGRVATGAASDVPHDQFGVLGTSF